jgi:hypothetical protein
VNGLEFRGQVKAPASIIPAMTTVGYFFSFTEDHGLSTVVCSSLMHPASCIYFFKKAGPP